MMNRASTRLASNVTVNFHYNNAIYTGTMMNYSNSDMYIKLEVPCTLTSLEKKFEIRIPAKDKILLAIARIKRVETYGKNLHCIGLELEHSIEIEGQLDN